VGDHTTGLRRNPKALGHSSLKQPSKHTPPSGVVHCGAPELNHGADETRPTLGGKERDDAQDFRPACLPTAPGNTSPWSGKEPAKYQLPSARKSPSSPLWVASALLCIPFFPTLQNKPDSSVLGVARKPAMVHGEVDRIVGSHSETTSR